METKQDIRQRLHARRQALAPAEVQAAGGAVLRALGDFGPYAGAHTVLAYWAEGNEVPTQPILADAERRRKHVWLPRIREEAFAAFLPGCTLRPGSLGILEPPGALAGWSPDAPSIALVPLVACDGYGGRIGRGRGWYDRVLTRLGPKVVRIGLAYEFQCCDRVPQGPADVALDFIITEARVVRCQAAAPGHGRRDA